MNWFTKKRLAAMYYFFDFCFLFAVFLLAIALVFRLETMSLAGLFIAQVICFFALLHVFFREDE